MEKSISRAISARGTSAASTATLEICASGASSRRVLASAGRNIISPKSDKETRQWTALVWGLNGWAAPKVDSSCANCAVNCGASCWHSFVGFKPLALRTNSSSSRACRSFASAWLVAGCDNASACPASVTDPVRCNATKTRNKLRSSCLNFIMNRYK